MIPPQAELEVILLGTGTSGCVPRIDCLTSPSTGCFCCRSTLNTADVEAQKNVRRNTSAVLKIPAEAGVVGAKGKTLLIDCGKTFYMGALEFWNKKGLREIDAVLLTHPHADAILGLDDLRGWTLGNGVQKSIPIYCDQDTFNEISRMFPYLCDSSKATGGGDVAALDWHIISPTSPFTLFGIEILPLRVEHGVYFTTPPTPYHCLGFLFDARICYLSDVSRIPESVWDAIGERCDLPEEWRPKEPRRDEVERIGKGLEGVRIANGLANGHGNGNANANANANGNGNGNGNGVQHNGVEHSQKKKPTLQVLIIDTLHVAAHTSHFGVAQAISTARRLGVVRTYLVGFNHSITHASWLSLLLSFSSSQHSTLPPLPQLARSAPPEHIWQFFSGSPLPGKEDREVFREHGLRCIEAWEGWEGREERSGFWVRPGCDGMRIMGGAKGVEDDVYG